jgi:hypothetical protein
MDTRLLSRCLICAALALAASAAAAPRALDPALQERARARELEEIGAGKGLPAPGETFADADMQKRVFTGLVVYEHFRAPGCADHAIVNTEALGRDVDARVVFERWTLERCGERVAYRLEFQPFFTRGRPLHSYVVIDERSSVTFSPE